MTSSDHDVVSDDPEAWVVGMADALRRAGVAVGIGQALACRNALAAVDDTDADDRYWAARLTLVADVADLAVFERVFRVVAGDVNDESPSRRDVSAVVDAGSDRAGAGGGADDEQVVVGAGASVRERLRHRRFTEASADERAAIDELFDQLRVSVPHRTSRRTRPGRAGVLDVARTLERAMTTDGELVERAWRRRMTTPRRLVVLLDVSGSMAPYARALLRFAIAARRTAQRQASRRVEVFAFGTRLTRLSDELARRDVDAAIAAAAQRVVDWDGGTRIGASIDELVRTWGPRGVLRGSVVVICSDGLERGDPQLLGDATARLARHAHRIVWVNPLAGDERYEPVQRGIAAAMASVDLLLPGHDFASIEGLVETLRTLR